jgi:hypothetical protein
MASSSSVTRVDSDLVESARQFGTTMSRSVSQQLTHWARIGRELETGASVTQSEIAQVLAGRRSYDDVGSEQQAVVRTDWSELIEARIGGLDFAEEFSAQSRPYSELDQDGRPVRRPS